MHMRESAPAHVCAQKRLTRLLRTLAIAASLASGCGHARVALVSSHEALTVRHPALYPETVLYDRKHERYLLGSFREGAVYQVDDAGNAARLIDDPRLCSVLGMAIDEERGWLWTLSSDLGASIEPSEAGPKATAAVAVYDLTTGANVHFVNLAALEPGPHLANGIALDAAGNAYVTDSFAATIYKVDRRGTPRVF